MQIKVNVITQRKVTVPQFICSPLLWTHCGLWQWPGQFPSMQAAYVRHQGVFLSVVTRFDSWAAWRVTIWEWTPAGNCSAPGHVSSVLNQNKTINPICPMWAPWHYTASQVLTDAWQKDSLSFLLCSLSFGRLSSSSSCTTFLPPGEREREVCQSASTKVTVSYKELGEVWIQASRGREKEGDRERGTRCLEREDYCGRMYRTVCI